jgi:Zn-dependent protease/CBS domain-containing protein
MNSGLPLGRAFGTEVRVHWTWVILLALITFIFGSGLSTQPDVGFDAAWGWGTAGATAILVFLSVAVHELAHVGIARRNGIGGNVVVIQLLGGTYVMEIRPRTAGQEMRVALAGPAVSLVLMIVFGILAGAVEITWGTSNTVPPGILAISFVAQVLAVFNVFLAATNLIPGYPLDGARIVHAFAWARSGRDDVATNVASRVGRYVGIAVMIAGGIVVAIVDFWPGLALIVAGWLLVGSSRILDRRLMLQDLLAGAKVGDAIDADTPHIPVQLTLDVFADEFLGARLGGIALVDRAGELVGLIGTSQIRRVPKRTWQTVHVEQIMVPISAVLRALPEADLWPVLEVMERSGTDAVLVGTADEASKLMTRRSVSLLIKARAEQHAHAVQATLRARGLLMGRPRGRPNLWPPDAPSGTDPAEPTAGPDESHDDRHDPGNGGPNAGGPTDDNRPEQS